MSMVFAVLAKPAHRRDEFDIRGLQSLTVPPIPQSAGGETSTVIHPITDVTDPPMAQRDQMLAGFPSARSIVHDHPADTSDRFIRLINEYNLAPGCSQAVDLTHLRWYRNQKHSVHPALPREVSKDNVLAIGSFEVEHNEVVSTARESGNDPSKALDCGGASEEWNNGGDREGFAERKAPRDWVGAVLKIGDRLLDPRAGRIPNVRGVIEDTRNRA